MPVLVLLVLTLGVVLALQCWLEHRLHGTDYNECVCEKESLECDYPYGN